MFKSRIIEENSYIINALNFGNILILVTSSALCFYNEHEKLIFLLKLSQIKSAKLKDERLFVLKNRTELHMYEIMNYDDIVAGHKTENIEIRKIGSMDIKRYGTMLLNYEIPNIHSIYYLNILDNFVILATLYGTCYILRKESLNYMGKYHLLAVPLALQAKNDSLLVLSKTGAKYYFTEYKIGTNIKKVFLPEEYTVPMNKNGYILMKKDYFFELDKCYSFVVLKEKTIFFSTHKIMLYHNFIKLFELGSELFLDRYFIVENKILILDGNSEEHLLEITNNKIINEECSVTKKRFKQYYNLLHRCTNACKFYPIKGSQIHFTSDKTVCYRYYDSSYKEVTVTRERNEITKAFPQIIKNYFVYKAYIFVITDKIEIFSVGSMKKTKYMPQETKAEIIAAQTNQYLRNAFIGPKTLVDILMVRKKVIMIFQTFLIFKERKCDIEYSSYHFNSKYLVFSHKNTVKLLHLQMIENDNHDEITNLFKHYTFNFIISDVMVYKRAFILLSEGKIIKIYDFKKGTFVFIQFFRSTISTMFFIENFLFVVSKRLLRIKIGKNYEFSYPKKIGDNCEFISKKRIISKRNEKVLLCVKQKENYMHFLITRKRVYDVSRDELYVSSYAIKFLDNEMKCYERKTQYYLKNMENTNNVSQSNTKNIIFLENMAITNHVNDTYSVLFNDSTKKQYDGCLKAAARFRNSLLVLIMKNDICFLDILEEDSIDSIELNHNFDLLAVYDDKILLVKHEKIFLYDLTCKYDSKKRKKYEVKTNGEVYIITSSPILKVIVRHHYIYLITKKDSLMIFYKAKLKYSIFETQYLANFEVLKDDLIITSDKIGIVRIYRINSDLKLIFVQDIRDILVSIALFENVIYYLTGSGTKGTIQVELETKS